MNNIIPQIKLKPVKIYITSTPEGFSCGIIDEHSYASEDYYISLTLAKGMLRLLLNNPDLIFDEGLMSLGEDFNSTVEHGVAMDLKEFLEKRKKKLH